MSLSAKVIKPTTITFNRDEIIPPEVVGWLTRTGRIMSMIDTGEIEIGNEVN